MSASSTRLALTRINAMPGRREQARLQVETSLMMKPLPALLLLFFVLMPGPLLAGTPDVWKYNDACEQSLSAADYPRAVYRCEAAADLAARIRPGSPEQASALEHLAQLRADQGRFDEASVLAQQASATIERVFGRDDPILVPTLNRQALIEQISGDFTQAERLLQRSQAILDLSAEPDDLAMADTQQRLGLLYNDMHRYAEAQRAFERAQSLLARYFGEDGVPKTMLPELIERAKAGALRPDAIAPDAAH